MERQNLSDEERRKIMLIIRKGQLDFEWNIINIGPDNIIPIIPTPIPGLCDDENQTAGVVNGIDIATG